ncbi:MAG: hypothetical protein V1837_07120 [Candidatus Woesearchaeota archaeon]
MTNLKLFLFLLLAIFSLIPLSEAAGCCAHIDFFNQGDYCVPNALTMDQCCPSAGVRYDSANPYLPDSRQECQNKFWFPSCSSSIGSKCYLGCCYDPITGCIGTTNDTCLGYFMAQKFVSGFPVDQRRSDGNPCYSRTGVAALAECTQDSTTSCSDYNSNQQTCSFKGCFWCQTATDKCIANCNACPSRQQDNNNDHICDSQASDNCADALRQNQADCISGQTMCKWCPALNQCMFNCDACAGKPFDTNPTDKVCDSGLNPQCADSEDNDNDGFTNTADFCCKDSTDIAEDNNCRCEEKGFCCPLGTLQCDHPVVQQYDHSSCATQCCTEPCKTIPVCSDSQIKFSSSKLANFCKCNNQPQNMTNPGVMDKFCCAGFMRDEPCTFTNFHGSVKDNEQILVLEPVSISLAGPSSYTFASYSGTFSHDVQPGTYTLTASLAGYETFTTQISISGQEKVYNIVLNKIVRLCNLDWPPIALKTYDVKCKKQVLVNWTFACQAKVISWTLYRGNVVIKDNIDKSVLKFLDDTVSWESSYDYHVVANMVNGQNTSNTVQIATGSPDCENICDGQHFCQGTPGSIVSCSAKNRLVLVEECDASQTCSIDRFGSPYCRSPDDCASTGLPFPNTFGMFGTFDNNIKHSCLTDSEGNVRSCYFDSSLTIADQCKDCLPETFCYDYQSESACSDDNCVSVKGSKRYTCAWFPNMPDSLKSGFGELGKGICYAPGYNGTEYCSRCSSSSSLFYNTHCTPQVCDLLGACFSKKGSCQACKVMPTEEYSSNQITKCSDFVDEKSCVQSNSAGASQPFHINRCANSLSGESFVLSRDACSLGVCKWKSGKCIKDANDDEIDDCSKLGVNCQKDSMPPKTTITKPQKVNHDGAVVAFSVSDYGWGSVPTNSFDTYYCLDLANSCCPLSKLGSSALTLSGDGTIPALVGVTGHVFLRFFSLDGYNNTEVIRSETIDVDTLRPSFVIGINISNSSNDEDTSILALTINASEPVHSCKDQLLKVADNSAQSLVSDGIIADTVLKPIYTDLDDGLYFYSINCTDSANNFNKTSNLIKIDRVHRIFNESPLEGRFAPSDIIKLSFKTFGERLDCFYERRQPTQGQRTLVSPTPSGNDYKYEVPFGTLPSGFYSYVIECELDHKKVDSSTILFVVDGLAPNTSISFEDYDNHFSAFRADSLYSRLKVKFVCDDSSSLIGSSPGSFGCAHTSYCADAVNSCSPAPGPQDGIVDLSGQSENFFLRYFSTDIGGNVEQLRSILVRVDKAAPILEIFVPKPGAVVGDQMLNVQGSWDDFADAAFVTLAWTSGVDANFTSFSASHDFSKQIRLFPGENKLSYRAEDHGVIGNPNIGSWQSLFVYYDTLGPDFSEVAITNHLGEQISFGSVAFYGRDINFSAKIVDSKWTNNITKANLSIECLNQSACSSYRRFFLMVGNGTRFRYTLKPRLSGILRPGPYQANIVAFDSLGNSNSFSSNFSVSGSTDLSAIILNHQGERIDDSSHSADYGRSISFIVESSTFEILSSVQAVLRCTTPSLCGSNPLLSTVDLIRSNRAYNYTLLPAPPGRILTPGIYEVIFLARDSFGKRDSLTLYFTVNDSSEVSAFAYNDLFERLDDSSHSARYGKRLYFNLTVNSPELVSSVQATIACVNRSLCGNYLENIPLERKGNSFFAVFVPARDGSGIFRPDLGLHNLLFTLKDNFGLYRTLLKNFTVADSSEPSINITVVTQTFNSVSGLPKVGVGKGSCKWYSVVVQADKPIKVNSLKAEVFNFDSDKPPLIDFNNLPRPILSFGNSTWTYRLCLPYESRYFRSLHGNNTKFLMDTEDFHHIHTAAILHGKFFEIDTFGGNAPKFFPNIPQTLYTKQNMLVLTGMLDPAEPISVFLNISGAIHATQAAGFSTVLGVEEVVASEGNHVEIAGNKQNLFAKGLFVRFENHNKTDITNYQIVDSVFQLSTQTTTLSLDSAPAAVPGEIIYLTDASKPAGWFSFSVPIPSQGINELSVWSVDELGNLGVKAVRQIMLDTTPFKIYSFTPHNRTISAESMPNITVVLADESSLINSSSIILSLNGVRHSCASDLACYSKGRYFVVAYKPSAPFADMQYLVHFVGSDILGNQNSISWSFGVDQTSPLLQSFEVLGGHYYRIPYDAWFTNNNQFSVRLLFAPGTISGSVSVGSLNLDCSNLEENEIGCSLPSQLSDGKYELVGSFRKSLDQGLGNPGRFTLFVVVDTVKPQVSFDKTYPSSRLSQHVTGRYSDPSMDQDDLVMVTGDSLAFPVKARLERSSFSADIFLNTAVEGNYSVIATAFDKAGNSATAQAVLVYDLRCSPVRVLDVVSNLGDKSVFKTSDLSYSTNVGTVIDALRANGIAEEGALRIFSSYKRGDSRTIESLQRTSTIDRQFAINLTIYQDEGDNFIRFENSDLAGNNYSITINISSDITPPSSPDVKVQQSFSKLVGIGSTSRSSIVSVPEPVCENLVANIERDSCLINRLLSGSAGVCTKITNYLLRISCTPLEVVP